MGPRYDDQGKVAHKAGAVKEVTVSLLIALLTNHQARRSRSYILVADNVRQARRRESVGAL